MSRTTAPFPALSLWQPHASLMANGSKGVETRGKRLGIQPGPLAIASTKSVPAGHRAQVINLTYREPFKSALGGRFSFSELPAGKILALVWVRGVETIDLATVSYVAARYSPAEVAFGFYDAGRVAIFTDPTRRIQLPTPIACRGAQGKWFLNAAEAAAIREQVDHDPAFPFYRDFLNPLTTHQPTT